MVAWPVAFLTQYTRETKAQADTAKVLTMDEARRIAANIAKLPTLLSVRNALSRSMPVSICCSGSRLWLLIAPGTQFPPLPGWPSPHRYWPASL